ncbi:MAG: FecR domain-containing protein [Lachnospiraceae bacterium]|nr:FecR domain-containing protein [Lachnospiraceae bacterium]
MKSKKRLIALIVGAVILIVGVVIILVATGVIGSKQQEYRVISVDSYEGDVKLARDNKDKELFSGINLKSGDKVSTGHKSEVLLLADSDKSLLASENTSFSIEASGDTKKGRIYINLEYGTTLITIENKLAEEDSFEIETPNAAMSVRGTVFEVTYNKETDETLLTVKEGCVEVVNDILSKLINEGESVVITDEEIVYVDDSDDDINDTEDTDKSDDAEEQGNDENIDDADITPVDATILADGVSEEEWPLILKNDVDITALEYCLGIMTKCKTEGNENYVAEALIDLDTNIYYKDPFDMIGNFQEGDFNYEWFTVYYVSELNNVYGLMPNGTINESNIPEDAHIVGNYLYINLNAPDEYCIAEGVDMDGLTNYIVANYYLPCPMSVSIDNIDVSQPNKIIIEYTYVLGDKDGNVLHEKSPFIAYLEPDAGGRYVITSIEKNN